MKFVLTYVYSEITSRENITPAKFNSVVIISVFVLFATWLVFAIDKETHQFSDLLTPGNLAALVVYFIPTFLICMLFHHVLSMKISNTKSMFLSLLMGVPVSFAGIIYALL
ncbi:MAG: hypothetical protein IPO63_17505 [Bacteroidetes bacterium]|nr:hypothetical protein [Bacteroidota bacterium]